MKRKITLVTALFALIVGLMARHTGPLLAQSQQPPLPGIGTQPTGDTDNILVMDTSGSMDDLDPSGENKLSAAQRAARNFLTMLTQTNSVVRQSHRAGVVDFDSFSRMQAPMSNDITASIQAIDALFTGGGTNMGDGLYLAIDQFPPADQSSAARYIILMTDGMANEGLVTIQEFVDGPVQRAVDNHICIHTVGFGSPGELDETMLQAIANGSGCGTYHLAANAYELNVTYVQLRHQNTGINPITFSNRIAQNETKPLGVYTVAANQSVLDASLLWPDGDLDLILTDPNGQVLDATTPGATLLVGEALKRMLVQNPLPGDWLISSYGRNVPATDIPVDVILTTQPAPAVIVPVSTGPDWGIIGALSLLLGLGAVVAVMFMRQSGTGWSIVVAEPGAQTRAVKVGRNGIWVGRDPSCDVQLRDPSVSRKHCWIGPVRGQTNRLFIRDNNSSSGIERNGEKILSGGFGESDQVVIGNAGLRAIHR